MTLLTRPSRRLGASLAFCLFTILALCARPALALEPRGSTYTLPIVNQTGLSSTDWTIYVLGFSTASQLQLEFSGNDATFQPFPAATGTLTATALGSGSTTVTLQASQELTGARIYFFIAPSSTAAPTVTYAGSGATVTQPLNPPTSTVPPYTFTEITVPAGGGLPTIDVQTVDGFFFPLTITLNGDLGEVGQPTGSTTVNRQSVFSAYEDFMAGEGTIGELYRPLKFTDQGGGLLNPYAYLQAIDSLNQLANVASPLNTIFDPAADELFSNTKLSIKGVSSGAIAAQVYTVTSTGSLTYPGSDLEHPALQFVGSGGTHLHVFNPVGMTVTSFVNAGHRIPILGSINGNKLTFDTPLPKDSLMMGMYVSGAGTGSPPPRIIGFTLGPGLAINGVTLSANLGRPPAHQQYLFSKVPSIFYSSGSMVFGNTGVFADATVLATDPDIQVVLANLENQLVSALNRGVANRGPTSGSAGYSTGYWGDQTKWYLAGEPQNLYSLFMHTGAIVTATGSTPIFKQPADAVANANGQLMGQAYGFAYDENPGPVPPAPANQPDVPSKFDPVPAGTTTMTITLGPWAPVTKVQMVGGTLQVLGTEGDDVILVNRAPRGRVVVFLNGVSQGSFGPVFNDILVECFGGNDQVRIDPRIRKRAVINGGAGNDLLVGGAAGDEINGGAGDDILYGRGGVDRLEGGGGRDRLHQ